jgi:hypothetical protein
MESDITDFKNYMPNVDSSDLIEIWKEIQNVTGDKFTKEDFINEETLSGPIKLENGGMDPTTVEAFKKLQEDCPGLIMDEDSYRTYDRQKELFIEYVKKYGSIKKAMRLRAIPGFSQHHTGKAIDIEPDSVRACVAKNASKYGFEFPYKGENTLRVKEPWHIYFTK